MAPPRQGLAAGRQVKLVIRPENAVSMNRSVRVASAYQPSSRRKIYQGALIRYRLTVAGQLMVAEVQNQVGRAQHEPGSHVTVYWYPERTEVLPVE